MFEIMLDTHCENNLDIFQKKKKSNILLVACSITRSWFIITLRVHDGLVTTHNGMLLATRLEFGVVDYREEKKMKLVISY